MNLAFFFQGSSVLLPVEIPDDQLDSGIPLDRLGDLIQIPGENHLVDQFEIPAIDDNTDDALIRGVSIPPNIKIPASWRAIQVRHGLSLVLDSKLNNQSRIGRLLRAYHISQWRLESVFCGQCGTKNTYDPAEQARLCPSCGRLEYPRISPAVITIIINDEDQVLLAHNKKFQSGMYSLIAGFNEAGENLEETVKREIREEVDIEVCDISYVVSQPWPFPNSLMLGFKARHLKGNIRPDNIEIEDVRWWSRDSLPSLPGKGSLSRYLIERWLDGTL